MQLCPSLMCIDYRNLAREIEDLDEAGADAFHCDVMDGSFVPNFAMGLGDLKAVRASTDKPVEVHLMIENPLDKLQLFIDAGANVIYIHPESERCTAKALEAVRAAGCKAGLAISPDTSIATVEEMLNLVDVVMVMTVYPGFAGQPFVEYTVDKIRRLSAMKDRYGFTLAIDGACSPERIRQLLPLGADAFVLGSSALFGKGGYRAVFEELRALSHLAAEGADEEKRQA